MSGGEASSYYALDFLYRVVLPWLVERPDRRRAAADLAASLIAAEKRRAETAMRLDIEIPMTLVVGLSTRCNLRCPSCLAIDEVAGPETALSRDAVDALLDEARTLGIARIALVGGEPLLALEFDRVIEDHPRLFFAVFTNGRAADAARLDRLAKQANIAMFVNVTATSRDRDAGGFDPEVPAILGRLRERGILFGFSATVHAGNSSMFADPGTYKEMARLGTRFGLLLDYFAEVGAAADPRQWIVPPDERARIVEIARRSGAALGMPVLCAPEDEKTNGGCGAAGRLLVYVSPEGTIEPCPFARRSSFRLETHGLRDALASPFFRAIRDRARDWSRRGAGCAVRAAPVEFLELAARHGAAAPGG